MADLLKSALNPPTLDLSVDRYAAWTIWKQKWSDYSLLTKLSEQSTEYQCALLRYTFTDETRNVYESFNLSTEDAKDPKKILEALESFSRGMVNETLERHLFNSRKQDDGEKFDDFLTDLKILSKNCNFCDNCYPGLLRDRIVGGIQDDKIRQSLLADNKLTLEKAEHLCRAGEKAVEGMSTLKGNSKIKEDEVSFVDSRGPKRQGKKQFSSLPQNAATTSRPQPTPARSCKFCLRTHLFGRSNCPAAGKRCNVCKQLNHFAGSSVCPQTSVSTVEESTLEVDNLFIGSVDFNEEDTKNETENDWQVQMKTTGGSVLFKVDTGADVTVIGQQHLPQFGLSRADIRKTRKSLRGPANQQLQCLGYIKANLSWGKKTASQIIYVCKNMATCLLGKPAIKALDMLRFSTESEVSCYSLESQEGQDILNEFPEIFQGLGNIKGAPIHIEIQEDATPYHLSTPRHVALPLLDPLKKELSRMEEMGVIRKVEEPTDWCHPIVLVRKENGSIRLCLDLTRLNTAVKREFYQLESVDETLAKLGDCNIMSKLDANSGYWQMPLDEDSQLKATFITPFGRFCPTRGPFGLSSMQEIFNKRLDKIISGLPGVVKSTDDFLVTGKDMAEHDERLRGLLQRLSDHGVTLNPTKCKFRQTAVDFLGHNISAAGVRPLSTKVDALLNFRTPENITELRRFFGMAQQLSKFTPELARASEPLRGLLSTNNSWVWTANHDAAFQETKKVLAKAPILAHYDVNKPTKLRTDGSLLNGIAAILYQQHGDQWKPVEFASRYLSDAEKNYHNIEIEMLAVAWGCEKMSKYLHGLRHFVIQTDHKPLIPILNYKPLTEMTPRIQRMRMRLLKFSFAAEYVKGTELADADALSRAPWSQATKEDEIVEQEIAAHVDTVICNIPATEPRIEEIKHETRADAVLQELINMVHKGWPSTIRECPEAIRPFWHCRHDITEIKGLILKGSQIVIPASMRRDMLDRIHEGHLGMEKCKRRARQCLYWPNMNNHIEQKIQRCGECAKLLPSKPAEPLLPHECPEKPWQKVGSDLFHWAGKMYVIIVDYFSLWPEVYLLGRPSSPNLVHAIKDAFSRHGIAKELVSDNGPQYAAREFKSFKSQWQFEHTTSSPHYPRSSGLAESTVKAVKRLIKKCHRSNQDILKGLLILRNTPIKCGQSPAQLLKGYTLRDNLPRFQEDSPTPSRFPAKERAQSKAYHDKKHATTRGSREEFQPGQAVAIQHETTKEWSVHGTIIQQVAPRSYEIQLTNGRKLRRNQRFMRKRYINFTATRSGLASIAVMPPERAVQERERVEDSDSDDADTIPYNQSDSDPTEQSSEEEAAENCRTRSGRMIKRKTPTDYDDL